MSRLLIRLVGKSDTLCQQNHEREKQAGDQGQGWRIGNIKQVGHCADDAAKRGQDQDGDGGDQPQQRILFT